MAGRMEDLIDLRTGASLKARDILALPDSQTFPIRKELEVAYVTKQNYLVKMAAAYLLQAALDRLRNLR